MAIVVDPEFGDRLLKITNFQHVWVLDSTTNSRSVQTYWRFIKNTDSEDQRSLLAEITTFASSSNESLEEICATLATDVDDHHGEFASDVIWSEIEVFGTTISPLLKGKYSSIGALNFENTETGFRCYR